jgi:Transposase DDE domain
MSWIEAEIAGVKLPDERYRSNFALISKELSEHYDVSFSRALGEGLRKSAWRLFSRGDLDLLTSHRSNSLSRCKSEKVVLAVEDTTDVSYKHRSKKGLGSLGGSKREGKGINIHSSLLLSERGECYGIFYQKLFSPLPSNKAIHRSKQSIESKESYKWFGALQNLNEHWGSSQAQTVIKISDRESDIYQLYKQERVEGFELLIRVKHENRSVFESEKKIPLSGILREANLKGFGTISLQKREKQAARIAHVKYYASSVVLPSTQANDDSKVAMNVIWVKEDSSQKDALDWALLTTLSVESLEDILTIVGYYTKRWVIERFHLILKSGLNIEKIQIDDAKRLVNVLQLYSLIAWHILSIQKLGQQQSKEVATDYFETEAVEILQAVTLKNIQTVADFIITLASLAGFTPTKQQPYPGEKTIWIAISKFNQIKNGFLAARKFYATG